jgi:hypothetical protein
LRGRIVLSLKPKNKENQACSEPLNKGDINMNEIHSMVGPVSNPTQSKEIDKLAKDLAKAQSEMGKVIKGSTNPFHKNKYGDLTACLDASLPHLNKNNISLVQGTDMVDDKFFVTSTLLHSSGQWILSKIYIPLTKLDAQGVGSATTYGRRYLLSAVCGLGQEDDDGNSISKLGAKAGLAHTPAMAKSPKNVSPKITTTATTRKPVPATVNKGGSNART